MPDSQNPEHVQKIVQEFQLKGQNLVPTVTGEIVPTIIIADLTKEERGDDRLSFGGRISATAGAGNQNLHQLVNPTSSGVILLLEQLFVYNATADATTDAIQITHTVATASPGMLWRDTRLPGKPAGTVLPATAATIVLGVPWYYVPADGLHLKLPFVVSPGRCVQIRQGAANQVFTSTWQWRERDLITGEK